MKIILPSTIALSAMCAIAALSADDQPKFEAASVKRMDRGVIHNSLGPGTVILKGDPLKVVLMEAFHMKTYQIVGPSWLDEDCFEIVAKMPEGATSDQVPAMLQALLAERFKLAAHKEDRPRPVYALVVDKGGAKFKEANFNFRRMGERPGLMMFRAASDIRGFKGAMTMATLAHFLSGSLDRPVQDLTGLKGTYDIDLSWAPDPGIDRQPSGATLGITHRDLKPANLLATKAGVKLLDFGLARIAVSPDETITMAVMGTPAYMAPEQWDGQPGDARSDIYALGCVLYEMLTGKRVSSERAAVAPAALESLLQTCLERDADERWQSAHDVKRALELAWQAPALPAPATRKFHWAGWVAAAASLLAAIYFFVAARPRTAGFGEVVSFAVYPPEKTTFSPALNTTSSVPQFALSPDGRTLAFVANASGGAPMLWLRPLGDVAAHSLLGTENAQQPFWSPDSHWLGFYADGRVKKVPAAGGAVRLVAETRSDFRGGAWGLDDTILFGSGTDPVYRVNAEGGDATPVHAEEEYKEVDRNPSFLPDGRHFLNLMQNASGQTGVYANSLDGKTKKLVLHVNMSAVYAPGGYLLYVDGDTLMGQAFNTVRLETNGKPFLVAEHAGHNSAFYSAVSASTAGLIAYAGTIPQNGRLTWFDRSGNMVSTAGPEADYTDFRLSPDGKSLAASLVDPKTGTIDIWINDLKRDNMSRFSSGRFVSATPAWSSDGARLVYRSFQFGLVTFYQRSTGGGGNEAPVLTLEAIRSAQIRSPNLIPTDWSPDGAFIMFSVPAPATGTDLWILSLTGDKKLSKFLATPSEEMHGNFSPDGHFVAYTSNESGRFEVYVQTFPLSDRKWKVSIHSGYEPRWRADGREIYYLSEDRKLMAVAVAAGPRFQAPVRLFQTRVGVGISANRTHYVPSRDGQRFLVNTLSGDPPSTPITVVLNWTAGLKK